MEQHKVIGDLILATKDTIFVLGQWLELLEQWRVLGQVDDQSLADACRQLRENGLWGWASQAGGHGIEALIGDQYPGKLWPGGATFQLVHSDTTACQLASQSRNGKQ